MKPVYTVRPSSREPNAYPVRAWYPMQAVETLFGVGNVRENFERVTLPDGTPALIYQYGNADHVAIVTGGDISA